MPQYTLTFNGRTRGAIGIFYTCRVTVEAATPQAALFTAYDTHEHIQSVLMVEHTDGPIIDGKPSLGPSVVIPPERYGR